MNKSIIALALLSLFGAAAHAEDAAAAPAAAAAANPLSFNVGAVSDYRYRGISQSRLQPALQGGADYAFASGLYVGTWLSTITWIRDGGKTVSPMVDSGSTPLELDLYAGYKGDIVKDTLSYDVGVLAYVYAGNKYANVGANANTTEIYGALTYGQFTAKYSSALTNTFGNANSKNSGYLDLSATFDVGAGFSVVPHVGHQTIKNSSPSATYTDYSLTVSKDIVTGLTLSASAIGTNASSTVYVTPDNKFLGKTSLVVGAKYSF